MANSFPSGKFSSSEIFKFLQEDGNMQLWSEQESMSAIIKPTKKSWVGGKSIVKSLSVDPGGGGFGGLNFQGGSFLGGDRVTNMVTTINPKLQQFTIQTDIITEKFSKSQQAAFVSHLEQEWNAKMQLQKNYHSVQEVGDGTGRIATPIGLGDTEAASGASFTLNSPATPLRIKMSSLSNAAGSVAHFFEGMVISFMYPEYDADNSGVSDADNTNCACRFLTLEFVAGSTKSYYDAFRVIKVMQEDNAILVAPARMSAPVGSGYVPSVTYTKPQYVRTQNSANMWCAGSGTVTVKPYHGMKTDLTIATVLTAIPNLTHLFSPEVVFSSTACQTAISLVCPQFIPTGDTNFGPIGSDYSSYGQTTYTNSQVARLILGLGWTGATDIGTLNPYWPTGLHALMTTENQLLHGLNRSQITQSAPTVFDHHNQSLDFNVIHRMLANHYNRNKGEMPEWSALILNPIVYSAMISLSELDRRIIEASNGVFRGSTGYSNYVQFGNKKVQFEQHSAMRHDFIYGVPQGAIEVYGGAVEKVEAGGNTEFLALVDGNRTNQHETYFTIVEERAWSKNPRLGAYIRNFTAPAV